MHLISLDEAKSIIDKHITPIQRKEILRLKNIVKFNADRVLSTNVTSNIDVPPFDRSAMDGYAVKFEDTQNACSKNPVVLKLVGSVFAGKKREIKTKINGKECMYVTTGSMLPTNANAVVMIENTKIQDDKIYVFKAARLFENVGKKGDDIMKGKVVLKKGEILTPAKIGVLAAIGIKEINLYSTPKVAIFGTGDEIIDVGKAITKGKIYDVNSYTVASVVRKARCIPVMLKIAKDKEEILEKRLNKALMFDACIISGGTSVGERDLLPKIVKGMGKILFHGVKIKPGKPTLFGIINNRPIFGMPGNPSACLMITYALLLPALRKMARLPYEQKVVKARMSEKFISKSDRDLLMPVKLENGMAKVSFKTSSAITSMSDAYGFIEVPVNKQVIEKDEYIDVNLFEI